MRLRFRGTMHILLCYIEKTMSYGSPRGDRRDVWQHLLNIKAPFVGARIYILDGQRRLDNDYMNAVASQPATTFYPGVSSR